MNPRNYPPPGTPALLRQIASERYPGIKGNEYRKLMAISNAVANVQFLLDMYGDIDKMIRGIDDEWNKEV
jgi:hypothetical protein